MECPNCGIRGGRVKVVRAGRLEWWCTVCAAGHYEESEVDERLAEAERLAVDEAEAIR